MSSIPKPTEFLLTSPLYSKTIYSGIETWDVVDLLYYDGTYDSYCPKCQRESTFQVVAPARPSGFVRNIYREHLDIQHGVSPTLPALQSGVHSVNAICTRDKSHRQNFIFLIDEAITRDGEGKILLQNTIEKIGQQPAYGDLHLAKIKRYKHVLTQAQLRELNRAIGLASHDVGVGSYVYLRRIFESLVEEAYQEAKSDPSWDDEAYVRSRMSERVTLLKGRLPSFLVDHPSMYSLMSKGIHELSEEDCLKHFETLRISIELILDERLEQKRHSQKVQEAKGALQRAIGEAGA